MKESGIKGLIIRPMEEEDVVKASELEAATFSMPWKAEDFLEMVRATYAYYFVAQMAENIVGIIGLRDICGEGEITNVAVSEDLRGLGIGRKLMQAALEQCGKLGIEAVTLEVRQSNEAAIGLYHAFGFESEGVRPGFYDNPKEDALIMWRRGQETRGLEC